MEIPDYLALVAKIALGDIGDNAEIEGEMLEDGFLKVWGIRRACEWVLGLHSVARQKQYCPVFSKSMDSPVKWISVGQKWQSCGCGPLY